MKNCGHDALIARLERRLLALERRVVTLEAENEQLRAENALLRAENAQLRAENRELRAENAELKARLARSSRNSSQPPSQDGPDVERPKFKKSARKRGGQPGHVGAERRRLHPDKVVDHRPRACRSCSNALSGSDPEPKWFQVFEVPVLKPHVTEHRAHSLKCKQCGTTTAAVLPAEVRAHGFGSRLSALVAYLTGRCRLSKRQAAELCEDVLGVPMSTGGICGIEQDISETLATPVAEAGEAVRAQPVVHMDETGWREDKKRAWLWVAVTTVAIVFRIATSRGQVIAREILGEGFSGRLVTDRWGGYNFMAPERRQLCWAHLIRDFAGMVDRGGTGALLAEELLKRTGKMTRWWARVREGTLPHSVFAKRMRPVRRDILKLLLLGDAGAELKTAGMCREILKLKAALFTFVDHEGIEPTNNSGERAIRAPVLWRKGSFGTDSQRGSRFAERILSAVATVRLRKGNVIEYLTAACTQYRATGRAPSLLAVAAC